MMPQVYGPSHGGKLTVQPDVSFSWLAVTPFAARLWCRWATGHQQVGRYSRSPRPAVARRGRHRSWSRTVRHAKCSTDGSESTQPKSLPANRRRRRVEIERGVWISLLNANRVSPEPVRLGQVRSLCTEPVRRPVRAPVQRHSASVTALFLGRTAGHRVLECLPRQVGHLMQAQLVSLIDIARQR
jgi:hypothetical protein